MQTDERFRRLLEADQKQLAEIDAVLTGESVQECLSLRLLRMSEVAKRLSVSRQTVWRLCAENRLRRVEIRKGSFRVPEAELLRFVGGE